MTDHERAQRREFFTILLQLGITLVGLWVLTDVIYRHITG